MTKNLILVGAGQFGREVYTWACQAIAGGAPWRMRGFLDDRPAVLEGLGYDVPILSPVAEYVPERADVFLCAVGTPRTKRTICHLIAAKGGEFTTLIHPTAVVGRNVQIGVGSIIGPLTQLSCDISLGRFVAFGTHSNTAHDTVIGDYSQVSGSCEINGCAKLGEGVFLGSHATILPGVQIGDYAYVGAGSVVLKRVRPAVKVFGNPAVVIGKVGDIA